MFIIKQLQVGSFIVGTRIHEDGSYNITIKQEHSHETDALIFTPEEAGGLVSAIEHIIEVWDRLPSPPNKETE